MKILIVTSPFFPVISPRSFRATELAKEFARLGHSVTVLTHDGEGLADFLVKRGIRFRNLPKPDWPVFKLQGTGILGLMKRAFMRVTGLLFEYPEVQLAFLIRRALRSESGYDLLVSIAVPYPVHWGVAMARRPKQQIARVWVADCGDPYMGNTLDTYRKPFYFKYIEQYFCRKAEYLTVPTEESIEGYYKEFHNKIKVIPQGFELPVLAADNIKPNKIPTFAYAGGFIRGHRDPAAFLEFLSRQVQPFRFIVYTAQPDMLAPYHNILREKLEVHPFIAREELIERLCTMDFLVNFDNNSKLMTPSKLIDYHIVGRPVLNIRNELDQQVIREFLGGDYHNRMLLPDISKYDIRNVASGFLDLSA